jgi:hypothetical protein
VGIPLTPLAAMPSPPGLQDDRLMSGLPTIATQPWPPTRFNPIAFDYRMWDASWSGDPDKRMRACFSIGSNGAIGRHYFATSGEAGISAVRASDASVLGPWVAPLGRPGTQVASCVTTAAGRAL